MEKWLLSGAVGGVAGFCTGVMKSLVMGGTLFDFLAVTPGTVSHSVNAVDLAFLGWCLGMVAWPIYLLWQEEYERVLVDFDEKRIERRTNIRQGNRIATLYDVDREALELIGRGTSRREAQKQGISEWRYNATMAKLKERKVTGEFDVAED